MKSSKMTERCTPKGHPWLLIGAIGSLALACGGGGTGTPPEPLSVTNPSENNKVSKAVVNNLPESFYPDSLGTIKLDSVTNSPIAKATTLLKPSLFKSKADPEEPTELYESTDFDDDIENHSHEEGRTHASDHPYGEAGVEDDHEHMAYDSEGCNDSGFTELKHMLKRIDDHREELAENYIILDQLLPAIRTAAGNMTSVSFEEGRFQLELDEEMIGSMAILANESLETPMENGQMISLPALDYQRYGVEEDHQESVKLIFSWENTLQLLWSDDRQQLKVVEQFSDQDHSGTVTFHKNDENDSFTLMEDINEADWTTTEHIHITEIDGVTNFDATQQVNGLESYRVHHSGHFNDDGGEIVSTFNHDVYSLTSEMDSDESWIVLADEHENIELGYFDLEEHRGEYWGEVDQFDSLRAITWDGFDAVEVAIEELQFSLGMLRTELEQVRERFSAEGEVLEMAWREGESGEWTIEEDSTFDRQWECEEDSNTVALSDSSFLNKNNMAIFIPTGVEVDAQNILQEALGFAFVISDETTEQGGRDVVVRVWSDVEALQAAEVYEFSKADQVLAKQPHVHLEAQTTVWDDVHEEHQDNEGFDEEYDEEYREDEDLDDTWEADQDDELYEFDELDHDEASRDRLGHHTNIEL